MSPITVSLPDGKALAVDEGSTVLSVAEMIGPGLAKAALAGRIDGRLVDLRLPLHENVALEIVTSRDPDGGDVLRHSAEHVMADAVKRLFPNAQVDAGRADHSEKFQYDFLVDEPFTPEDLEKIEAEMNGILAEKASFGRQVVTRDEARALFADMGETLKLERLADIPDGQDITIFRHGGFADLCRGPHVQSTGQIGAVKLLEASGVYFKGNEAGPKLQRIYGTAFADKKELKAYLARIEEARKRDHRRVGPQLDLFHLDPVAPGSPFYLPRGMVVYNGLIDYVKSLYPKYGFDEVMTPQLCRSELYKTSGHYDMFKDDMYFFAGSDEGEEIGVKATNCPGHCAVFGSRLRSYRELPLRFAEFSRLHRNERSGTLNGLARVRSMAQDDAHIFCERDQVAGEVDRFFQLVAEIYGSLGLEGVHMAVSTRPDEFLGDVADWDAGEKALIEAVERAGFECKVKPGEAAFYGPKVEADFEDVLGRRWTLATIQIDMAMPARFDLSYIGRDGEPHQPAMLHRAVLGSLERFMAIFIEHTGGDFPFWLSPLQVSVVPIAERQAVYAREVHEQLRAAGLRSQLDDRSETLGYRIRDAEQGKVPLVLVIGDQEVEGGTVSPRLRKSKKKIDAIPTVELVAQLASANSERRLGPFK